MIPRTLFTRLSLALAILLLGIGLLHVLITAVLTRHHEQSFQQNLNRDLAQNLVTERKLISDGILDQQALKKTFHHYMMVNPSIEIYLLDRSGAILSYSAEPGKVKRSHVDLQAIGEFLEGGRFPILGDDPRSYQRRKVFSATPIPSAEKPDGYLYVVLRGEEHERLEQLFQNNFLLQLSGIALLLSLVAGLVVGLLLFRLMTRRLRALSGLMQGFSESNFTRYAPYAEQRPAEDEIEVLGRNYNSMAERIREQIDALKRQDRLRRDLVANVSHDLRTPLAALHGYLETLKLKSPALDAITRAEYLDIALQHSGHLTGLVDQLFDLARLEADEIKLHCEPFAPAELVQDVLQKFRLAADQRHITLTMESADALPFVNADIALTERVLENLLSNALRHTPPGGQVVVALESSSAEVQIRVRDSGCGIAEQDLPHVFERFFQGGGVQRSEQHAGLGLAIARQIVKLHGSHIDVSSNTGQGSCFYFTLPSCTAA